MPPVHPEHPAEPLSSEHPGRQKLAIVLAILAVVPGFAIRVLGLHPDPLLAASLFGLAVVGAAFMLAWGAEVIQLDISAGLALALLALIAVLPEYAVDFVFTWKAGKDPVTYAPDALANMTGGNQLLIGVGWSMVVLVAAYRVRAARRGKGPRPLPPNIDLSTTDIVLERSHSVEIAFLVIATLYGLTLPLKSSLTLFDSAVLVTIFVLYMFRIARAPAEEPHLVGPAQLIGTLPEAKRRVVVGLLFLGSVVAILLAAEPFAESLIETGEQFNIDKFLLVQLVAPIASEAPELLVAGLFAWRLNTNAGFGALVSSKVNQWTLLVGTLPIVFAISSSSAARPADRRGAARRALGHGRAVGVRGRGAGEPAHQRGRRVLVARTLARAARDEVRRPDGRRAEAGPHQRRRGLHGAGDLHRLAQPSRRATAPRGRLPHAVRRALTRGTGVGMTAMRSRRRAA